MSRNHFTKECHKRDRDQLARQEKQLALLARQLRRGITESPIIPPLVGAKKRRSARLVQNRLHKAHRDLNDHSLVLLTTQDR